MHVIEADEAIAVARAALGLDAGASGEAHLVRRLDRPLGDYFLVVFAAAGTVAVVRATDALVSAKARAADPLTLSTGDAARIAGGDVSAATLVWAPSQASRSQLYPVWQIPTSSGPRYVDQSGKLWGNLAPPGPGG